MTELSATKRLFKYSPKDTRLLHIAVFFGLVASLIIIFAPRLLSKLMDQIENDLGTSEFSGDTLNTIIILVVMAVMGVIIATIARWIIVVASVNLTNKLRRDIFNKTARIPYSFFIRAKAGDLTSRIINDCSTITDSAGRCLVSSITSVTIMVGTAVIMLITNTELAVASIFPISSGILIMIFINGSSKYYYKEEQKTLGQANSHIIENFQGQTVIKSYCAEAESNEHFDSTNHKLKRISFKTGIYTTLSPSIMGLISNLSYITVCGYGAIMVVEGKISISIIIGFLVYVKLFAESVLNFIRSHTASMKVEAAAFRAFEILDAEEIEERNRVDIGTVRGEIEFDHVTFSYDGKTNAINDVSLHISPGAKVAIIGYSGSGKTTLMNLLMGFYEADSGGIRIDGHPLSHLNYHQVLELFSLVSQDNWVFKGTFRDNIVYTSPPRDDEEILRLCDSIGLSFIRNLEHGLDTMIENPSSLSTGQKQQIAIARASIRDSPILIMDEATSSVDMKTEKSIIDSMNRMSKSRTTFIIAHRLSTVRSANTIVVMDKGRIIEVGSPKELMEKQGFYYELNRIQNGDPI